MHVKLVYRQDCAGFKTTSKYTRKHQLLTEKMLFK